MIGHKRIPSREGGIEVVVERLSKELQLKGHEVVVYNRCFNLFHKKWREDYQGLTIINIPTLRSPVLGVPLYSLFAVIHAVIFGGFNIIHIHAEGPAIMSWLPSCLGIRTIVTIHGLDWQRAKWGRGASWFLKKGEKMAAVHADELIVLSENVQKYFKDTYKKSTQYIPNGVDISTGIYDFKKINDRYSLKKQQYILFVARIVPEKGLHYLIEAFQQISTDKKLAIAGDACGCDEYLDGLKTAALQDERILFLGFVQQPELDSLIHHAYLYVLPSEVEGMSMSLLEAMSHGKCCLVSNIPENREVISGFGPIFENKNTEDLKNHLEYLIKHPAAVQRYGRAACSKVRQYDWKALTERTLKLYGKKQKPENSDGE